MYYCKNDSSLNILWQNGGLNECLFFTIQHLILSVFLSTFALFQFFCYRKYALLIPAEYYLRKRNPLFFLHIFFHIFMILEAILEFIFHFAWTKEESGYQLLVALAGLLNYTVALMLMFLERRYFLLSNRSNGHGTVLMVFWGLSCFGNILCLTSWSSSEWWWKLSSREDIVELSLWIVRLVFSFLILIFGFVAPGIVRITIRDGQLLSPTESASERAPNFWRRLKLLFPFFWPRKNPLLQFYIAVSFLFLVAGRVVNLLIPIYNKHIVNSLTVTTSNSSTVSISWVLGQAQLGNIAFRWDLILVYCFLRFLQGSGSMSTGFLNNFRAIFWIYIDQHASRKFAVELFSHFHTLPFRWHLGRKTGEVIRSVDRGTNSIGEFLDYFVFSVIPTISDIIIAIIYFISAFNIWFALIAIVTMIFFFWLTFKLAIWRAKYRKTMNKYDNARNARAVDSLLNFETVKHHGTRELEANRYEEATLEYQREEWMANLALSFMGFAQISVISLGLLTGSLLCAYLVVNGDGMTVGDFVLFSSYILQLYNPLSSFGSDFKIIQKAFIDMENMIDLMTIEPEIKDDCRAAAIKINEGKIEFENVSFHYEPSKPILKNVSFTIPPGQTCALVGPSGGGKLTILRLLFRFYDIQSGAIRIDDQDIAKMEQNSLNECIGIVPQDTMLFNDTIRSNILYGRGDAGNEEVEDAACAVGLHEWILTLPAGYDTVVGERGLKLSSGEKQRVAIARALLKHPRIMLLGEATSSLDAQAESTIQSSLSLMCKGRTTLVVSHHLSTIIGVDQILVLKNGEIVERGTHQELFNLNGLYTDMWTKQLAAEESCFRHDFCIPTLFH